MHQSELPWDSERGTRRWHEELTPEERQAKTDQAEALLLAALGLELGADGTARRREQLPWKEVAHS